MRIFHVSFMAIIGFLIFASSNVKAVDMGEIFCGNTRNGSIVKSGQSDFFTFTGTAGQVTGIKVGIESGLMNPRIFLYAPDGTLEASAYAYNYVNLRDHLLKQSGTYTIVIRDRNGDKTGNYSLSLLLIWPSQPEADFTSDSTFNFAPVKVFSTDSLFVDWEGVYNNSYTTISDAYSDSYSGVEINVRSGIYDDIVVESEINFNTDGLAFDLIGGWNSNFTAFEGNSTIFGSLTISGGTVNVKNICIAELVYYVCMGDSITYGTGDDDPSDDTSNDGRNTGGGYEPILNNLLTSYFTLPHNVFNTATQGGRSEDGAADVSLILSNHPEAHKFLVMYGTNDARPWEPVPSGLGLSSDDPGYPGTFKDNMQQIIDAINATGKKVCLAKIPITLGDGVHTAPYDDPDSGARNFWIKKYNQVIDELTYDPLNNITIIPPDFYSLFNEEVPGGKRYEFEYTDNLHPNGSGYRSMAYKWFQTLIQ